MNRKLLAAVVSGALVLPMAAQGVEVSVSGHVNRAIMVVDDGKHTDARQMEGAASGSRIRFTGSEDLDNGMTAGVNLEIGLDGATHHKTGPDNRADGGLSDDGSNEEGEAADDPIRLRQVNVYFSGPFGKLTLGQQSFANDLTSYASKDDYAWLGGIEAGCDFGCDTKFRESGDDDVASYFDKEGDEHHITADSMVIYSNFRDDLLRYDSPSLGPATVSVSAGNNDYYDISAEIAGEIGDNSYQFLAGTDSNDKIEMSGAVGFAQGTHFAAGWATQRNREKEVGMEKAPPDPSTWHVMLGHNFGNSSVSFLYLNSDDVIDITSAVERDERGEMFCGDGYCKGSSWGVGFGHALPDAGVELYASYRTWEADIPGVDLDNINIFVVGSRIKFN